MALSKKGRIVLGISISVLLITVGAIAYGAWSIYSFLQQVGEYTAAEIPTELSEPRVLVGSAFLSKREIFRKRVLSMSEAILEGAKIKNDEERNRFTESESAKRVYGFSDLKLCGESIVAVGKFGGYILATDGVQEKTILFEPIISEVKILFFWKHKYNRQTLDELRIVDIEGDGKCEYVSRSSIDGFALFDSTGKAIWRYGVRHTDELFSKRVAETEQWVTAASFGDVDDDGKLDFVISRKNDGIRAFDSQQKEIWFQPDEFPTADFKFIDIDGDGKKELIEFQGAGSSIRERQTGKMLRKLELNGGKDGILEVHNGKSKPEARLFDLDENKLTLSDLNETNVFEVNAPLSEVKRSAPSGKSADPYYTDTENVYEPKAELVALRAGQKKYLVILASFISIPRTNLYIYELDGTLIYHELLDEEAETISIVPNDDGTEGFLVGGKDTIWRYSAN